MRLGQYLIIGTLILLSCGVKKSQTDSDTHIPIATEAWMDYDKDDDVSYVDIYKFGQIRIPGKWKHSGLPGNRQSGRLVYENDENEMIIVDIGVPDTMTFYKKGMEDKEFLNKLYEQGITFWNRKGDGQIETVEDNSDNVIGKLTVEPTRQIFYLFGLRDNKSMTIYFVSTKRDDKDKVDLLKKVFNG